LFDPEVAPVDVLFAEPGEAGELGDRFGSLIALQVVAFVERDGVVLESERLALLQSLL
jgi:hypothetical protein